MSKFRDFRIKNKSALPTDPSIFVEIGKNESTGSKAIDTLIKQAQKSGVLNLANRNLTEIPSGVYKINIAQISEKSINFEQTDDSWWDDVFLSKLILTANMIVNINEDICLLDKLSYLDISDNKINILPNSLTKLTQLKFLNLSKNKISKIPDDFGHFQELQHLQCSYNNLKSIPEEIGCLSNLINVDLSHNELTEFPASITKLSLLNKLDLSYNQITTMPFTLEKLQKLQILDLSQNKINSFCKEFCAPIQQLWLHVNRLSEFPLHRKVTDLKEISLTHNLITKLTSDQLLNMPNIYTLTIANNKLSEIPEEISKLSKLSSLDLSNNDLKTLPLSIGNMDELKILSIDGNPFRLIKRSIVNSGADSIKKFLRIRNTADEPDNSFGPGLQALNRSTINGGSLQLDQTELRTTGIVKLSAKGLAEISDDILDSLKSITVKGLNLNGNKFTIFPMSIFQFASTLFELDLSSNQISELPPNIDRLEVLRRLDISHNKIRILPDSLIKIKSLAYLLLSYNTIGDVIPDVIYQLDGLQTLAMSHCGLTVLDSNKIRSLTNLEVLDVSNNSIASIPAELGLCEKIKSLNLDGNCFKVPRAAIIARGTSSVLEYLRSRIVTSQ